jgi:predicted acyl esterase
LIFNRKDFDIKKVEQVQMMQRLAIQQHALMEFIAKTEELVLKIETNADLSYSDIMGVKGHMNQWCEGLETLEEKKKRIREEKKAEEREKREKEEAEKRRKEKEEREAEEKRRKQEKEKKRRDWKNWPPFM